MDIVRIWNSSPNDIVNATSVQSFKFGVTGQSRKMEWFSLNYKEDEVSSAA